MAGGPEGRRRTAWERRERRRDGRRDGMRRVMGGALAFFASLQVCGDSKLSQVPCNLFLNWTGPVYSQLLGSGHAPNEVML